MHIVIFTLTAQEDFKGLKHWEIPSKNPDRIILTFMVIQLHQEL